MSAMERFVDTVMDHSRVAIVAMLLLTAGIGAGAGQVEQASSLDQFQTESTESKKLEYIQSNFTVGDRNTTAAQIVVRGENVLSKDGLLATLRFQQRLRANETINETLTANGSIVGVANVIATTAIVQERVSALRANASRLERRRAALERNRTELEERQAELNRTAQRLRDALTTLRRDPAANVTVQFEQVRANTTVELNASDFATFRRAAEEVRTARNRSQLQAAYRLGTRGVLSEEFTALSYRADALQAEARELRALAEQVRAQREDIQNGTDPTLAEQIAQLESMNESAIDDTVRTVLSEDGERSGQVFALMSTEYAPGSTTANATVLLITQVTPETTSVQGAAAESIVESQLAMRDLGQARGDAYEYLVFGSGVISHEIDSSMGDSLLIVGPLALLFVLAALVVAYRDLFDIALGLTGIAIVLVWTFGFMGWADIAFNQIFVAVPVLLIGLSIDYAIHIFMRHREERQASGEGSRGAMRVGLVGVGIALVWVTATTVIGFLSNLTSPVPPIREFGVVSAVGITAALLVFGVLIPAVKVELDEVLERLGLDRRKRAFGTGGGRFSRVLALGATAARRAPYVVIALTLVVTAAGAVGGTQVDTTFEQEDFIAEDPPAWMKDLPEPFAPGEYTAKRNLQFVNENFIREDSQAQILIEGAITDPATLDRLAEAQAEAPGKAVTQTLPNGEADITSVLTVMEAVAAENSTFNATLAAADTDGDGVPDRDVAGVYDALYAAAPDRARGVLYRTEDGDYAALRLVISVRGDAAGDAVTTQMRALAAGIDGDGVTATATGRKILSTLVQDQLLETVIQSLVITLIAVFLFLMLAYRITEGSATLGVVTLLPVALTVAWILGTMFLLDIPFNVLTGTITSLTVGLGVAYGIHISERYNQELERHGTIQAAMRTTVTGTGGALLGSAATTVGGFGVLAFAILPPLQQFGIITGITIIYAFLASVLVLPTLLTVWTKAIGVEASGGATGPAPGGEPSDPFAADGFVPATQHRNTEPEDDD